MVMTATQTQFYEFRSVDAKESCGAQISAQASAIAKILAPVNFYSICTQQEPHNSLFFTSSYKG